MGTQLQLAGLESGGCGEAWNVSHPDKILAIQSSYVEAGSDLLTTNTFGGSRIMLERHGAAPDVRAINREGARIARRAFGDRDGFVVGDIGPFGGLMEPLGEYREDDVYRSFCEQANALMEGGADALIIETQTVLEELEQGVRAAKQAGCDCVIASMAFDLTNETQEIRTMMGTGPSEAAERINDLEVDIIALNCGAGMDMKIASEAVRIYRELSGLPVMVQPNAGVPQIVDGRVVYLETPEQMVEAASKLMEETPVEIIGACCGSTPQHIAGLRKMIEGMSQ